MFPFVYLPRPGSMSRAERAQPTEDLHDLYEKGHSAITVFTGVTILL